MAYRSKYRVHADGFIHKDHLETLSMVDCDSQGQPPRPRRPEQKDGDDIVSVDAVRAATDVDRPLAM